MSIRQLKIEINARERFAVLGTAKRVFTVNNPWFSGTADITVYHLEELLGTKLRALHQRKRGRDLHDPWAALATGKPILGRITDCFQRYMAHDGAAVSRAEFEANLAAKLSSNVFLEDVRPLIRADAGYDPVMAARIVKDKPIGRLPEEPWRGSVLASPPPL